PAVAPPAAGTTRQRTAPIGSVDAGGVQEGEHVVAPHRDRAGVGGEVGVAPLLRASIRRIELRPVRIPPAADLGAEQFARPEAVIVLRLDQSEAASDGARHAGTSGMEFGMKRITSFSPSSVEHGL